MISRFIFKPVSNAPFIVNNIALCMLLLFYNIVVFFLFEKFIKKEENKDQSFNKKKFTL